MVGIKWYCASVAVNMSKSQEIIKKLCKKANIMQMVN